MERWFVALCGICSRWLFSVASNSLSRLMVPSPSLSSPPLLTSVPLPSPLLLHPLLLSSPPLACFPSYPFFFSSSPIQTAAWTWSRDIILCPRSDTGSLCLCLCGFLFYWLNLVGVLVVSAAFLTPRWENEAGMNTNRGWVIEKRHW